MARLFFGVSNKTFNIFCSCYSHVFVSIANKFWRLVMFNAYNKFIKSQPFAAGTPFPLLRIYAQIAQMFATTKAPHIKALGL